PGRRFPEATHEMIVVRAAVVVILAFGVLLATRLYRGWRVRVIAERPDHPLVPAALRGNAERTWVVFTTPYCASCGPVEESLRASDPDARVVRVDATREPVLADAFKVRSAPTAVLADADGQVQARLVGAEAVLRWTSARA
ncbi:MAG: thioredoxin family protein, partial [Actinomycetota bacterium]|nr:thioredoxin family protein [Actinomycetota bacterium]